MTIPLWLEWARRLQATAQSGLAYNDNVYDRERYEAILALAGEILAQYTTLDPKPTVAAFRQQIGYATPKVDVRGAVVRDGKVLLVQERSDGRWCLPGGWADVGESPAEMVVREVQEESGLEVAPRKVVAVYDANRSPDKPAEFYHAYKIIFLCDITGGAVQASYETLAVDFFPFDQLPPLSSDRTSERVLCEVAAHVADEARPTAFD